MNSTENMNELEKADLARELHDLIRSAVPGCSFSAKYGGALYTMKPKEIDCHFCGVFVRDDHVQLEFGMGARLRDPKKLLVGKNKLRRHVNLYSSEDVNGDALVGLLKQAARK